MTKREARQAWIKAIIDGRCEGKVAAFARAIGKDSSYVSRMLYPVGKVGGKGIGEDMVMAIVQAFPDLPPPAGAHVPPTASEPAAGNAVPAQLFTKERRANDDVTALQIGLESLLLAVLQRTPGAAAAFLEDVTAVASGRRFSTEAGFLGELVGIARRVHDTEEEAAQARRRAGSAGRTRRGSRDQAR